VWREGADEPLASEALIADSGIGAGERVYIGTCKRVAATVNFGEDSKVHALPPSATQRALGAKLRSRARVDERSRGRLELKSRRLSRFSRSRPRCMNSPHAHTYSSH
jgi:hypothetical protein